MWTDYYLKFTGADEYMQHMPEDLKAPTSETHATDVVGILFRNDTFEELDGYHVNLRLRDSTPLPEPLAAYVVGTPDYPKRVFA